MEFDYKNVPEELKKLKQWVLWKKKDMPNGKTTKIPISAVTGNGADVNDSSCWVTFEKATKEIDYFRCSGLGFVFGGGYFGIDIDQALNNTKLINEFATTLNTYAEISQSGEGVHIICKGTLPGDENRQNNVEMYQDGRFFALTGSLLEKEYSNINECTELIKPLYEKYIKNKSKKKISKQEIGSLLTDSKVIEKASKCAYAEEFKQLYKGEFLFKFASQNDADYSLVKMLAFWCGRDSIQIDRLFRNSGLMRDKWDKEYKGSTYGSVTINQACLNTHNVYTKTTQRVDPETGEVISKKYELTDTGNAMRFIDTYGSNLRFIIKDGWYVWNGKVWDKDCTFQVTRFANKLLYSMQEEAYAETDTIKQKFLFLNVKRLASHMGKEAMMKEACAIGKTTIEITEFDTQKYLLNCKNGIVDLHTGLIQPHDKSYLMTKCTNIDYIKGRPVRWIQFLHEIFKGEESELKADFMQTAMGYTLTGDTSEQCLFQCYGKGSNGKGVFFDIMIKILGSYGMTGNAETILKTRGISNASGPTPDIASMNGKRLVVMQEAEENARYNEPLLKTLTGGTDEISARQMYGNPFSFKPTFKLWLATNYKIKVRGTDYGIWRRQRLMGFNETFKDVNEIGKKDDAQLLEKKLPEKLNEELTSILHWAVQGCLRWQKEELDKPAFMKKDLEEYQKENDTLQMFLDEKIEEHKGSSIKAGVLFKIYKSWAVEGNEYCMSQTKFGGELKNRGFDKIKANGGYQTYQNISFIDPRDYDLIKR